MSTENSEDIECPLCKMGKLYVVSEAAVQSEIFKENGVIKINEKTTTVLNIFDEERRLQCNICKASLSSVEEEFPENSDAEAIEEFYKILEILI